MLVEKIQEIIEDFNLSELIQPSKIWNFNYGSNEWQNLGDYPDDVDLPFQERKKYLLLLWKDRDLIINDQGGTEGATFTGDMILSLRSKLSDPSFEYKYDTHIKNLEAVSERFKESFIGCDNFIVRKWKEVTVNDVYDTNMDGLKISFTIEFIG